MHLVFLIGQDEASARLQTRRGTFTEGGGNGIYSLSQENVIDLHICAVIRLSVKEAAERTMRLGLARTQDAIHLKNLLGMSKTEANITVIEHIDQKVRMERVN